MKALAGTLALILTGAAIFSVRTEAADLNAPAAPAGLKDAPDVPAIAWTGFYGGLNGGYGWSANDLSIYVIGTEPGGRGSTTITEVSPVTKYDRSGGFGGGQIGYNLQRDRIVFGVETDLQGADIRGSGSASVVLPQISGRIPAISALGYREGTLDWFGTVRGRLGYAYDQALIYFTGGLAYGGNHGVASIELEQGAVTHSFTDHPGATRLGYVLGGGVEYALNPILVTQGRISIHRSWTVKWLCILQCRRYRTREFHNRSKLQYRPSWRKLSPAAGIYPSEVGAVPGSTSKRRDQRVSVQGPRWSVSQVAIFLRVSTSSGCMIATCICLCCPWLCACLPHCCRPSPRSAASASPGQEWRLIP